MRLRDSRQLVMTEHPLLSQAITRAASVLAGAGIATARTDAELLASHLLGISRGELAAAQITGRNLDFDFSDYDQLVADRSQRIPLQHLTGKAPFRNLELAVGPGVFIPRPETESVAQAAIDAVAAAVAAASHAHDPVIAVDLCTGSGAIALALTQETAASEIHGVEYSELAFAWAQRNHELLAQSHGVDLASKLQLHKADATDPHTLAELDGLVAVVVSNPPYIPPDQVPVDVEVREHDPEIALYGRGPDGLEVPRAVLNRAQQLLRPGGVVVVEHAEVQAPALRAAAAAMGGWEEIQTRPDLTGRPRMLYARRAADGGKMGE